jgi:hypothetical protein
MHMLGGSGSMRNCLAIAVLGGGSLSAASLCTTTTLDQYAGTSCSIGNYLFTFGGGAYNYLQDLTPAPASSVLVTPVGTGTSGSPTGFIFAAPGWIADNAGATFADINLAFSVGFNPGFDPSQVINRADMALGVNIGLPDGFGNGVLGGETFFNPSDPVAPAINLTILGNDDATSLGFGGTALSGSAVLNQSSYDISKDIFLAAFSSSTAQVTGITETFT